MKISRFQKLFGVGPIGFASDVVLLSLLWLLDWRLGHVAISSNPKPVMIPGLALIVFWMCWHIWCLRTILQWWRDSRLCTEGPFRFVRHPMYAGVIWLLNPGIALVLNSWILLLCPFLMLVIGTALVRREETMMAEVFGEAYTRYAARTGRLFPRSLGKNPRESASVSG